MPKTLGPARTSARSADTFNKYRNLTTNCNLIRTRKSFNLPLVFVRVAYNDHLTQLTRFDIVVQHKIAVGHNERRAVSNECLFISKGEP